MRIDLTGKTTREYYALHFPFIKRYCLPKFFCAAHGRHQDTDSFSIFTKGTVMPEPQPGECWEWLGKELFIAARGCGDANVPNGSEYKAASVWTGTFFDRLVEAKKRHIHSKIIEEEFHDEWKAERQKRLNIAAKKHLPWKGNRIADRARSECMRAGSDLLSQLALSWWFEKGCMLFDEHMDYVKKFDGAVSEISMDVTYKVMRGLGAYSREARTTPAGGKRKKEGHEWVAFKAMATTIASAAHKLILDCAVVPSESITHMLAAHTRIWAPVLMELRRQHEGNTWHVHIEPFWALFVCLFVC